MLLGVVLLYVGAVLVINGIWLIGQARVADVGEAGARAAEAHPFFIQGREVAVINTFTGFVGVVAFTLLYLWLVLHRSRAMAMEDLLEDQGLDEALAARRAEAVAL